MCFPWGISVASRTICGFPKIPCWRPQPSGMCWSVHPFSCHPDRERSEENKRKILQTRDCIKCKAGDQKHDPSEFHRTNIKYCKNKEQENQKVQLYKCHSVPPYAAMPSHCPSQTAWRHQSFLINRFISLSVPESCPT